MNWLRRIRGAHSRFARDAGAASAVEFALVAFPFIFMLLGTLQVAIYYMTQASLDTGVANTADYLRSQFAGNNSTPTEPDAEALQAKVIALSGGLISTSNTAVEIQPLSNLYSNANLAINGATNDYDTADSTATLVLRAQAKIVLLVPFNSFAYVSSSAIVRKKGSG